jgi:hypothetical protein
VIFYKHVWRSISDYFEGTVLWSVKEYVRILGEKTGLIPYFEWVVDLGSVLMTEVFRGLVLFALFSLAGCGFYHLRVERRITYGCIELFIALIAMLIAINGMVGGDFSAGYLIALLSGLYIMVRGLQNVDDGLSSLAQREDPKSKWTALHEIWQAFFYEPYTGSSMNARRERIKKAWATLRAAPQTPVRQQEEVPAEKAAELEKSDR